MIVIFTEAGTGIGLGHYTRMVALAAAFLKLGSTVRMVVEWQGAVPEDFVPLPPYVELAPWANGELTAFASLDRVAFIVDSYRADLEAVRDRIPRSAPLLLVDDTYRLGLPCDLVINPNSFASPDEYPERPALAGPNWVLIREEVRSHRGSFRVGEVLRNVLVTLGGSDPQGFGLDVADAVASSGWDVRVIRPGDAPRHRMRNAVTVEKPSGVGRFLRLVQEADVVVTGGGQTLNEMACLGVPCLGVEIADNQRQNLAWFGSRGILPSRRITASGAKGITDLVSELNAMASPAVRQKRSMLGLRAIDGGGADRLAAEVLRRVSLFEALS